jgi:hypothetical protein
LKYAALHRSGCITPAAALIPYLQASAAARIAKENAERGWKNNFTTSFFRFSEKLEDGVSVLCRLIADANFINKQFGYI